MKEDLATLLLVADLVFLVFRIFPSTWTPVLDGSQHVLGVSKKMKGVYIASFFYHTTASKKFGMYHSINIRLLEVITIE
jgi:hypothetical protein